MDDKEFYLVYLQYKDLMAKVAYDIVQDYHLAQDVCHDVFLGMSRSRIETLTISDSTKNQLATIAHFRAIDVYRKRKRLNEIPLDQLENIPMDKSIEDKIEMGAMLGEIFKDLRENRPQWYDIVVHINVYGESGEVAARELGLSITNLRTQYHRAKKYIAKKHSTDIESYF